MAYSKRYGGGFVDLPSQTTAADAQFFNAVEAALLKLLTADGSADGQVLQWINASSRFGPALLLNKNVDAAAAIDWTKLNTTGKIVNADVAGAAAIAKSKLDFGTGIANADIAAAAAIAISKLAGYPTDGTKVLLGDGTWSSSQFSLAKFHPIPLAVNTNSTAAQVANEAHGYLFFLPHKVSITNFYVGVSITGNNYDFGIYDTTFTPLWRYGSHAVPAASAGTAVTVAVSAGTPATSPLVLPAGYYYLVSVADNVTPNFASVRIAGNATAANRAGLSGVAALDALPLVFKKAAAFPLPSPIATPTAWDYSAANFDIIMVEGV